ncbi:hypothetical protein [Actinopolymorpha rutila]|uniref:Uncharacterized protein n=1 Tax=Actinopolymorpha rutila TaxID=446787 RepID=A0A852ZHF4_9ACTN|nr:hypothetical protein [Actinopolymorpha rutila]NYH87716.1 hypothetical protein [Actinopolymorpha rutila]
MTAVGTVSAGVLLGYARAVLSGTTAMPKTRAPRIAAVLARQALEETVQQLCTSAGAPLSDATMRSRLISLRFLVSRDHAGRIADLAEAAWNGLSGACHHHAFELTPTVGEVHGLINCVAELTVFASTVAAKTADER